MNNQYILRTKFNSFDATVDVLFGNTKKSPGLRQDKNYNWFIEKQDQISNEILKRIFIYYKSSYANYKKGWTINSEISNDELEEYLPTPTTAGNPKPFITPIAIHIQSGRKL